jgi:hypothetical protein
MSLSNLGIRLSAVARRRWRRRNKSSPSRRRLAETRPTPFLPDLAWSLGAQGHALARAERHADAAGAFHEGLAIIAPFVERHAQAFGELAATSARNTLPRAKRRGPRPTPRCPNVLRGRAAVKGIPMKLRSRH